MLRLYYYHLLFSVGQYIQSFHKWYPGYKYKENWNARSVLVLYTSTLECSDLVFFEKMENADPVVDANLKSKTHLGKAFFNFFSYSSHNRLQSWLNCANTTCKIIFENIKTDTISKERFLHCFKIRWKSRKNVESENLFSDFFQLKSAKNNFFAFVSTFFKLYSRTLPERLNIKESLL